MDGLRGIAALVVVIHHALLIHPTLELQYEVGQRGPAMGTALWWFTSTPVHLVWAGGEAVLVFFVLSGLVLALPYLNGDRAPQWERYFPRRIVRLYLPVIAAVILAATALRMLLPHPIDGANPLLAKGLQAIRPVAVFQDLALVGSPGRVIGPLWSLKWEVIFSLVLPAFVIGAQVVRGRGWLALATLIAIMLGGGLVSEPALFYLPVFALGVLLAGSVEPIAALCRRARPWQWAVVIVVAADLLMSRWILLGLPVFAPLVRHERLFDSVTSVAGALGAAMAVVVAWRCPLVVTILETRVIDWLGVRSFSLYLLHWPIMIIVAVAFGGWHPVGVVVAIAGSLLVTELFYRLVERPGIDLARRVGAAAGALAWNARPAANPDT